jgi:hypothetical protein
VSTENQEPPGDPLDRELAELAGMDDDGFDDELTDALVSALDELEEDDEDVIELLDADELRALADKLDHLGRLDLDAHGILLANVLVELGAGQALSVLVSFEEGVPALLPHEVQRLAG